MKRSFKALLKASFKSADTEEWLDIWFTRPIGLCITLVAERLKITPNSITIASIILGVAGGACFYSTALWWNVAGVALLMTANFCDCADGQLARLTNQKTLIGRMLDGAAGDFWFVAAYTAISLRLWSQDIPLTDVHWGPLGFVLCAVAGIHCHARQSRLADYYRQIHLWFLLGKSGSELDDYATQVKTLNALPRKGAFWARRFYQNYAAYCHAQEKATPAFQRFYKSIRGRWADVSAMPAGLRSDFREGSLPLMKWTNILTHNTRATVMYISCLVGLPWVYPLFEILVLSVIYTHMHRSHEALCGRLYDKYCK